MHPRALPDLNVDPGPIRIARASGPCCHHLDVVAGGTERPHGVVDERPGKVAAPSWIGRGEDADAAHAGSDIAGAEPTWPRRPRRAPIRKTKARPSRNRI